MHQEGMQFRGLGHVHRLEHQPRRCDDVLHALLFDLYSSARLQSLDTERYASGAGSSGSEARAEAVPRRLQAG